ncbi:MAG: Nif3-like dinuclear metal center hexameric protein [Eubacteriales bacterium]
MMDFNRLAAFFTNKYPDSLACAWDNDGVMLEGVRPVRRALLSLDATPACADYAIKCGFDVIITHHPLIFRPLRSITRGHIYDLAAAGIGVISLHTRLDAVRGGVNEALGELIGLSDIEICADDPEHILRTGTLCAEMEFGAFAAHVKQRLGAPYLNAMTGGRPIKNVAFCGGDGKDFLETAYKCGADAYLTGTLSYNSFTDYAGRGMGIISAGHFYTENPVLRVLRRDITSADGGIYTEIFESNPVGAVF